MHKSNRYFESKEAERAFNNGYDSKAVEIKEMGWCAARDKLNADLPPGQMVSVSSMGLWYCKGEAEALLDYAPR